MRTVKIRLKPNNKQNTKLHECARASARMFHSCGYCFYCGKETVEVGKDYVKIQDLFVRDVCCYIKLAEKERVCPGRYAAGFCFDGFTWCILIHIQEDCIVKRPVEAKKQDVNSNIINIDRLYKKQARLQRTLERKNRAAKSKDNVSNRKRKTQWALKKVQNTIRSHHSEI